MLLKLGTYGLFGCASHDARGRGGSRARHRRLATIGVIYALICWVQEDVKKLVAYSSVSHLGFCVLGLLP